MNTNLDQHLNPVPDDFQDPERFADLRRRALKYRGVGLKKWHDWLAGKGYVESLVAKPLAQKQGGFPYGDWFRLKDDSNHCLRIVRVDGSIPAVVLGDYGGTWLSLEDVARFWEHAPTPDGPWKEVEL